MHAWGGTGGACKLSQKLHAWTTPTVKTCIWPATFPNLEENVGLAKCIPLPEMHAPTNFPYTRANLLDARLMDARARTHRTLHLTHVLVSIGHSGQPIGVRRVRASGVVDPT